MFIRRAFLSFLAIGRRQRGILALVIVVAITSSSAAFAVSYLALGTLNSTNATTILEADVNAAVLRVSNKNLSGTSVRGLAIAVPANRPPITVNPEAGKATNLNADLLDGLEAENFLGVKDTAVDSERLDGLNSTQFARATRIQILSNRLVTASQHSVLLVMPGLGSLTTACYAQPNGAIAEVLYSNTTSGAVRVMVDAVSTGFEVFTVPASSTLLVSRWNTETSHGTGMNAQLGAGTGASNRSASIQAAAFRPSKGSGCEFQATASLWTASSKHHPEPARHGVTPRRAVTFLSGRGSPTPRSQTLAIQQPLS